MFRKTLLASSIEFICRFWRYPSIIENPQIGESIRAAQALTLPPYHTATGTSTGRSRVFHQPAVQEFPK